MSSHDYNGDLFVKGAGTKRVRWIDTAGTEYSIISVGNEILVQENTNTEASPTWVTRAILGINGAQIIRPGNFAFFMGT